MLDIVLGKQQQPRTKEIEKLFAIS